MPRISQGEITLQGALDDLVRDWQLTGGNWQDQAREQFEHDVIEEYLPAGRAAVRAMTELTLLLRRVVRECS